MAQRAFPNPYADYNKSLAEGYFDPEGRVSRGRRRPHPLLQPPALARSSALPQGRRIPLKTNDTSNAVMTT